MREKPASLTAIGDGELASHVAWKDGEITFSNSRFALEHARGQGQAVVSLGAPRPHVRAALALDYLDLNPFLATGAKAARTDRQSSPPPGAGAETRDGKSGPGRTERVARPKSQGGGRPPETKARRARPNPPPDVAPEATSAAPAPDAQGATSATPAPASSATPAAFD